MTFSEPVQKLINFYSRSLNLAEEQVIDNIVISYLARKAASECVFGHHKDVLPEFMRVNGEPARGQVLYSLLLQQYVQELRPVEGGFGVPEPRPAPIEGVDLGDDDPTWKTPAQLEAELKKDGELK